MTPERWQKLYQLFDAAIELPADERAAFLDTASAGDRVLRAEVERLLAAAAKGGPAMTTAVGMAAADLVASPQAGPAAGQKIGIYEVIRPLGKGGMGEVFLALDPRLKRQIAIKLLTRDYSADAWRVHRFQQEARLASALNHPNILVVHDLGEFEGRQFLATEYVEGRTLRGELASGPLAAGRVLDIAIQAAAALTAAHQAGIVHRDVKPENIMVRPDGYVKVLDFGLAKLTERTSSDTALQTDTMVSMPGMVVGTVEYMSPEQARGDTVGRQSDIFSLGVVLYELLAGAPPFRGPTPADSLSLILQGPLPPLELRAPGTPPELVRIVSQALARKLDQRYRSMAELQADIKALKQGLDARAVLTRSNAIPAAVQPMRRSFLWWGAGAGVAGAAAVASRFVLHRPPINPDAIRIARIPTANEVAGGLISPDGNYILTVRDSEGMTSLWVRQRLENAGEIQVAAPAPAGYWGLTWSPDGKFLYCTVTNRVAGSSGVLYRQPALGGTRQRIADRVDTNAVADPSGKRVIFRRNHADGESPGLFLLDDSGEHLLAVSDIPYAFYFYYWTPDGKAIHYVSGTRLSSNDWTLKEIVPGSPRETTVLRGQQGPLACPVMLERSGIFAVSADSDTGLRQIWYISIPGGQRYRITHDAGEYTYLTVTADGKTILASQQVIENDLWVADLGDRTAPPRRITNGAGGYSSAAWLPGGKLVAAVTTANATNLYMMEPGATPRQLTFTGDIHAYNPAVSRDGRFLAFSGGVRGAADLRLLDLQSGAVRQLVGGQHVGDAVFSADGKTVYFTSSSVTDWALYKIAFEGGAPVRLTDCQETTPTISPDGGRLATLYSTAAAERFLVLLDLATGVETRKPLSRSIGDLSWISNDALFYNIQSGPDAGVWLLPLDGGAHRHVFHPGQPRMWGYSIDRAGKQVAYAAGRTLLNLVQITNFR